MPDSSFDIARFLTGVLRVRDNLHGVYNHYVRRGNKVHWGANVTGPVWAEDGYIEHGLTVTGSDGKRYALSARLRWPGEQWVVEAEAALEREDAARNFEYPTLRGLPTKTSDGWHEALENFAAAVSGLASFDDVIPARE